MNNMDIITLRELLECDTASGELFWKNSKGHEHLEGRRALNKLNRNGYRVGIINKRHYSAHRVVWAFHHDAWPTKPIDHINGIRSDNRICNLRCVSFSHNMRNTKMRVSNTSGVVGVTWHAKCQKWQAGIKVHGKSIHLGLFEKIEDAAAARTEAETKYGFHPNHGRAA